MCGLIVLSESSVKYLLVCLMYRTIEARNDLYHRRVLLSVEISSYLDINKSIMTNV